MNWSIVAYFVAVANMAIAGWYKYTGVDWMFSAFLCCAMFLVAIYIQRANEDKE